MEKKELSKGLKTFFGFGQLGIIFKSNVHTYLPAFFITDIARLPASVFTIASTVSLLVCMVVFPALGAFLNKQKGKLRKYLILFPLFNVVAFTFCYTKMGSLPVCTIILTIAYTLTAFNTSAYGVTLMSLMPEIANNADERSLLSSRSALWQNVSKFLYALTGTAILAFIIKLVGGETVGAYTILALSVSLFALLTCLVDYFITSGYERVPEISTETASATQAKKKVSFGETIKVIFSNGQLVIQLVVTFAMTFGNVLLNSMLMYYYTYVAENVALMSVHLLLSNIIAVVSSFVAPFLTGKIGNKGISLLGLGIMIAGFLVCWMLGVASAVAFIVGGSLANLGMCFVSVVRYAILADCAIYSEWKSGFNATAIIMSVNTSIVSLAAAVRSIAIAFSLAMAGYSAGMTPTPELKAGLVNGCVLIPLILTVISFVLTFFYKLTKEQVDEYSKEIANRATAE